MTASLHGSETRRQANPHAVLERPQDPALSEIAVLAARACGAPMAVLAVPDGEREWYAASWGITLDALPAESALSSAAVHSGELVVVPDARADRRLSEHPLVSGEPRIRFLAAAPAVSADGGVPGALCVLDRVPRNLNAAQRGALLALGRQAARLLGLHARLLAREPAELAAVDSGAGFRLLAEGLPQIVWTLGADGGFEYANQRGLAYVGLTSAQLGNREHARMLVHAEDHERLRHTWHEAHTSAAAFRIGARLRRRDGSYRWHLIQGQPLRDDHGRIRRWIGTATDVHDVKESEERSAFLLAVSTELARISDPQELVCTAMLRLCQHLNVTQATLAEIDPASGEAILLTQRAGEEAPLEISSLPLESLWQLLLRPEAGHASVLADTSSDERTAASFANWYAPRGILALVAVPLQRGGERVAVLSVAHRAARRWSASEVQLVTRVADILWPALERARADSAIAEREERLRLAQSVARVGVWEWDPSSDECVLAPECHELLGLDAGAHRMSELLARTVPDDLPAVRAALEQCATGGSCEIDYRHRHPLRGVRWIHTRAGAAMQAGRNRVVGIHSDVTERKQAEESLREVNQRKDEFLAMLAHELRNPLAPIRNAAQILRVHAKGNTKLEWARAVIERQCRQLTHLVDDLLDVSRIVRGRITLERAPVEVSQLVSQALETSRPLLRQRGQQLTVTLQPGLPHLQGDLARLVQVLDNLLGNAAKYTPEGGHIWLDAEHERGQLVLRVRDSGIGITADLLPHVFDLFTQGERTLDRSQGGLGIGLTMVKRIVEMHGGSVDAMSAGPGCGSEFVVRLHLPEELSHPEHGASAPASVTPVRILVVDDNVDGAESIAMLLRMEGHAVRSVHDARDALAVAPSFRPDVVLLDIGLPGMDGYEVARRLRAEPNLAHTCLVAITGYGQPSDRERAREAGFHEHLVKPVEPEALHATLSALRPRR